jgi:excisionase family DNA binding protein
VTAVTEAARPYAERLMTVEDVAAYTTLSRTKIERAVKAGDLRCGTPTRDGKRSRLLFRRQDVDAWLFDPKPVARQVRSLPVPVDPRSRQRRRPS